MKPHERICAALDVPDPQSAARLAQKLVGHVGMLKVGLELFVAHGPFAVEAVRSLGLPIFLDLKLHDIPQTVEGAARGVSALGVQFVTAHASGGSEMIAAAKRGLGSSGTKLLAVTALTSLGPAELDAIGLSRDAVPRLAKLAIDAGADGVVCSPQEVAALRALLGPGPLLVVPGIRPAGAAANDQRRTGTPAETVRAGATYLVVGRPLRDAPDPAAAADAIAAELAGQFCPYHGIEHSWDEPFSDEHVVPFGVGGSNELTIRVCKHSNSEIGTKVDHPFMDNFFIGSERVTRDIRGQSGEPPSWTLEGQVEIEGRQVPSKYKITSEGAVLWMRPDVQRHPGEQERIEVACSVDQLEGILKNVNKKLQKQGRPQISVTDAVKQGHTVHVEQPVMSVADSIDITVFPRGFVKMALGTAHFVLGENFSRSADADLLRSYMWEDDKEKRSKMPLNGMSFPSVNPAIPIFQHNDSHVLVLTNSGPLSFFCLLFGKYAGSVKLSDDLGRYKDVIPPGPGSGVVIVIDPLSRRTRRFDLGEFLIKKQENRLD